jgi:hypothetical protein
MDGNPAEAVIEAVEEHMATWRPPSGMAFYEMIARLPDLFEALHDALGGVVSGVGEEQDLPDWFGTAMGQVLKSVTAAAEQAAGVDEEFRKAYGFFLADKRQQQERGRRRKR